MIRLRPKPACPAHLRSAAVAKAKKALERSYRKHRTIKRTEFKSSIWLRDDVRLTLHRYQNGKCCYCERKREPKREPDIEHFRPKGKIAEDRRKAGYWWLAYEWSNLYFSCKPCNEDFKKTHFPLRSTGVRARKATADLTLEKPILPDPGIEDPELLIGYDWDVQLEEAWPIPRNRERGGAIIEILGLDRELLNGERGALIALLAPIAQMMHCALHLGNQALERRSALQIARQTRRNQQFAGFRRYYFTKIGLGAYVAKD